MRSKGLEFGANESYNQLKRLRKFTVVFTGPEICRRVLPCRGGVLQSLDTATPQAPPTTFPQRHLRHHQPRSHSDTSGTTNHVPRDTATPQAPPTTLVVGGWWCLRVGGWWCLRAISAWEPQTPPTRDAQGQHRWTHNWRRRP